MYSAASSLIVETIEASSYLPSSGLSNAAQDSRVSGSPSTARQLLSANVSTVHGFEYSGDGSTSLSGSSAIGQDLSFAEASDRDIQSGSEPRSVLLTHPRLVSLPSRLAEIATLRPGSARVVTPLRRHIDTLIEHETGLPQEETPEEFAERVEHEQKEQEEVLQRLKEEEEEALREEARIVEEEAAIRRCTHFWFVSQNQISIYGLADSCAQVFSVLMIISRFVVAGLRRKQKWRAGFLRSHRLPRLALSAPSAPRRTNCATTRLW